MDLTEREKAQNELISKRYEGKNPPGTLTPGSSAGASMQPRTPSSSAGQKRAREDEGAGPSEYYKLPGMSDLTEREQRQNELLCKRYQKKE